MGNVSIVFLEKDIISFIPCMTSFGRKIKQTTQLPAVFTTLGMLHGSILSICFAEKLKLN